MFEQVQAGRKVSNSKMGTQVKFEASATNSAACQSVSEQSDQSNQINLHGKWASACEPVEPDEFCNGGEVLTPHGIDTGL